MKRVRPAVAVIAGLVAALVLSACAKAGTEPPDRPTPLTNSPFCQQVLAFRTLTDNLNGQALLATPQAVRSEVAAAHASLVKLAAVAPPTLKSDVSTVADAFGRLADTLANLKTTDTLVLIQAVSQVAGDKVTQTAVSHIDAYALNQCGLNTYGGTTVPTTAPPVGPVAPTTTSTTSAPTSSPSTAPGSTSTPPTSTGSPSPSSSAPPSPTTTTK
jgi:hypothetical protein